MCIGTLVDHNHPLAGKQFQINSWTAFNPAMGILPNTTITIKGYRKSPFPNDTTADSLDFIAEPTNNIRASHDMITQYNTQEVCHFNAIAFSNALNNKLITPAQL